MVTNTLLTNTMITRESARILSNELTFTKGVNREYDKNFAKSGAKIGTTVNVRKPPRYIGRTGPTMSIEDSVETPVPVTLTTQFGVDIEFSSADLTLSIDDFSERFIKPAMVTVANKIDFDGLALYKQIYNAVGTIGTTPSTAAAILAAGQRLDEEAAPRDKRRSMVLNPAANAGLVGGLTGLFNNQQKISTQYDTGNMGAALGFNMSMDQNINVHTVGPLGGTPLVNGAGQSGSTLITDGWTASAALRLNVGDVFTIAGVRAVNPQNRTSTGTLRQFVVTAAFSSNAGGAGNISISPAIVASGKFQTVDAAPADNAVITVLGTAGQQYPANLGYHRDAFTLATADLIMPKGVDMSARESYEGISIRMVRAYDVRNDLMPCRLDVLYGWAVIYPELACRLVG